MQIEKKASRSNKATRRIEVGQYKLIDWDKKTA